MAVTFVLLSGPVASGKSTVAESLAASTGALVYSTSEILRVLARSEGRFPKGRRALQDEGDRRDDETGGAWVADFVKSDMSSRASSPTVVIVDSVRTSEQVEHMRGSFGRRVAHVHFTAPVPIVTARYGERSGTDGELDSYAAVQENATEAAVEGLSDRADIVIDTSRSRPVDVHIRCAARLGLLPPTSSPVVDLLVGGAFGSEGKGNIAFHLSPEYDLLIRSGGPNAGHKVPTNPVYTHRLLPSGTQACDAGLALAPGMTIDVDCLLQEIEDCELAPSRLAIDPQAIVIEPEDKSREAFGAAAIGSTGSGAGAATARRILGARIGPDSYRMAQDIPDLEPYVRPLSDVLAEAARSGHAVLVEGTQGSELSLYHGSFPYVTSRDTNSGGLLAETGLPPHAIRRTVLVIRSYPIRVGGNSGPMGSAEIDWSEVAVRSGLAPDVLATTEVGSVSGRQRRVAEFNWELLRSAAVRNAPTDVALTFVDYLDSANGEAFRFEQLTAATREFVDEVELVAGCPVSILSTGFGHGRELIDRRRWRGWFGQRSGIAE